MGLAALLGIGRPDRMMRTIDEALDAALDAAALDALDELAAETIFIFYMAVLL